jgi:hypothetical protein
MVLHHRWLGLRDLKDISGENLPLATLREEVTTPLSQLDLCLPYLSRLSKINLWLLRRCYAFPLSWHRSLPGKFGILVSGGAKSHFQSLLRI